MKNKTEIKEKIKTLKLSNTETTATKSSFSRKQNLNSKNVNLAFTIVNFIQVTSYFIPRFYTKPKIHKEGIPGRPVVSSFNCHSSKISEYVYYHLQPLVQEIFSYIKDTCNFPGKLKHITEVTENSYLVTLDVKSLHTSIPNSEGIKAVKRSNENFTRKTIATKVITTFLALILTLNNFIFNS